MCGLVVCVYVLLSVCVCLKKLSSILLLRSGAFLHSTTIRWSDLESVYVWVGLANFRIVYMSGGHASKL